MADYFTTGVVTPYLPCDAFTQEECDELSEHGFTFHLNTLKKDGEPNYYIYAEEYAGEEAAEVLQGVLKKLPEEEFPYIYFEAGFTCTKMRSDGYGGCAWFITRDKIEYTGTGSWIVKQIAKYERRKKK
jgi:hypothetical protein